MKRGDRVVLRGIPDLVIANRDRFPETYEILSKSVGRRFIVRGKNLAGMAELWINQDGTNSSSPCADSLFVETEYLEIAAAPD
jgi:hypothetical protein